MEFDLILVLKSSREAIVSLLNEYGGAGWKPIHFYDTGSQLGIILTREKMVRVPAVENKPRRGRPPKNPVL